MKINILRIDDRLIHGQVVTAWMNYCNARQVVVADDKVANDTFQQSLLKMATPKGVELKIYDIPTARQELKKEDDADTLFLVRGPKEADSLLMSSEKIKSINVGNLNMRKGKKKILDNLWLSKEDYNAILSLMDKGIDLEYRTLPNDSSQNLKELIKKYTEA